MKALSHARVWKRYLGDRFLSINRSRIGDLLQHNNNQQTAFLFYYETESEDKIAFLDTTVHRDMSGSLCKSVYRKLIHTVQYLAYDSHHPQSVKRGVVKCLYYKAHNGERKIKKKQHIVRALKHV